MKINTESTFDSWGDTFKGLFIDNQELAFLPILLIFGFIVGSLVLMKANKEEKRNSKNDSEVAGASD